MKTQTPPRYKTLAVIPAAGSGTRMGAKRKIYLPLCGLPALVRTLLAFEGAASVDAVVVVTAAGDMDECMETIARARAITKVISVVAGGAERQDSVHNGLMRSDGFDFIAVHDGARPLVTAEIIDGVVFAAHETGGAIAAVPVKDTIKESSDGVVVRTVPRSALVAAQTPQVFRRELLLRAFELARRDGFTGTDESALVERLGGVKIRLAAGSYDNIKITTEEDVTIAERILQKRGALNPA